jgi:hypothetical protein
VIRASTLTAARRPPVDVLEVRNGELMESITEQAAARGIT